MSSPLPDEAYYMSWSEIAEALDMPRSTVRKTAERALAKLRAALAEAGIDETWYAAYCHARDAALTEIPISGACLPAPTPARENLPRRLRDVK